MRPGLTGYDAVRCDASRLVMQHHAVLEGAREARDCAFEMGMANATKRIVRYTRSMRRVVGDKSQPMCVCMTRQPPITATSSSCGEYPASISKLNCTKNTAQQRILGAKLDVVDVVRLRWFHQNDAAGDWWRCALERAGACRHPPLPVRTT